MPQSPVVRPDENPEPSQRSLLGTDHGQPPPEIVEFIRFCHRRRPIGWPELYDEMWAVAARREFNGWGEEQFAAYGVTFSLYTMPRLAAWVRMVIAEPRSTPDLPLVAAATV
jgi:hypothetical protein